jgi:uncharacterized protein (DUF1800 family)
MSQWRSRGLPWRVSALALCAAAALSSTASQAALGTAVEFYHPVLRHYFLTADADEIAGLDAGSVIKGWVRTGGEFAVYTDPGPDRRPVCRFFGVLGPDLSSHFYTSDAAECDHVKTLPPWQYEKIAYYVLSPSNGACPAGATPVYRSFFSDQVRDVNHRFSVDLTAASRHALQPGWVSEGIVMCAPLSDADLHADAVRLLEQASLGPTEAAVSEVKAKGPAAWIDEQLKRNVTRYTQYPTMVAPTTGLECVDDASPPVTPAKYCWTNKWSQRPVALEFFRQAKSAPDQLRLRMAHAWHQIFVLNLNGGVGGAYAHAEFQQRLRDHAFGTFENLLIKYALSPQLGFFQNWVLNFPEHDGIRPNENFARELMQLFTIGVDMLNDDGTPKLGVNGQPIPSYRQSDIETLARVLTGYTFPTMPGKSGGFWENEAYYVGDMIPFNAPYHDDGYKNLLGGRLILYAGGGAEFEVRAAIKMLVDHPNTPAFISRQLIQKTVTSAPTPGYVKRVADVFRNNGKGVRGDLAAVTRAILLDPEARGARKIDAQYGRLREPVLFWTAMLRALDVATDGWNPFQATAFESQQELFNAPTVFNYYPADYVLPGTTIPAPEFGIFTSAEYLNRVNQVNDLLFNVDQPWNAPWWGPQPFLANATGTPSPSMAAFLADAADPEALVARLDRLLLHGTMSAPMRKVIVNAVTKVPAANAQRRVKLAANLILTSIDYQVQK